MRMGFRVCLCIVRAGRGRAGQGEPLLAHWVGAGPKGSEGGQMGNGNWVSACVYVLGEHVQIRERGCSHGGAL